MEAVYKLVKKYSVTIIIIVLLLTLIMGYFAFQIDIEAGIKDMLPESNPVVEKFDDVSETFGSITYTAIMLEDENILDYDTLQKIESMTAEFHEIENVSDIKSIINIKDIQSEADGIIVEEYIEDIPEKDSELDDLKKTLKNQEQYVGKFYTEDFKNTMMIVNFEEAEKQEVVVNKLKDIIADYEGPEKMYMAGMPVMATNANEYMKRDIRHLFPFVIAAIIAILYISFRKINGVILPISTVLISVIWSLGIQKLLGKSLSIISTVLPVLLVSVGSAYAIHIVARYYEELDNGGDSEMAVKKAINQVGLAVTMAGGTTMIGFGSLFFSDLAIIKDFALGITIGVGIALLTSLFFIPSVLIKLDGNSIKKSEGENKTVQKFFEGIKNIAFNRRPIMLIVVAILIIVSLIAIPQLRTESNYISYFKKGTETRTATELIDEKFGGSQSIEVVVNGNIKNPELLEKMRDFQEEVKELSLINNTYSMVNIFREENAALEEGEGNKVIPTTRNQIAQYLLLLEMSDQEMISNFLTFDYNTSRIQMTIETTSSSRQKAVIGDIEKLIDKHFGDDYEVQLTGIPSITNEVTRLIVRGQIKSLISAVIFTFIITSILLKSLKGGLLTTTPIALTVLFNFGLMGLFGINLDIATVMIASIAIGIGVDYSIHIYTRYQEEKDLGYSLKEALKTSIQTVGRANLYNASAVIAGFGVVLFSSFPPLVRFGGLTAITMVVSFIGALIILPVLILSTNKVVNGENNLTDKLKK
ncbi:MAG: MMPL family transporter [Halanaerobiales bacterium]